MSDVEFFDTESVAKAQSAERTVATMRNIQVQSPAPKPGRHGIALVAMVRDEARWIAEWATFYLLAGVRHFFIYDHCCVDRTVHILRDIIPANKLTVIPWHFYHLIVQRDWPAGYEIRYEGYWIEFQTLCYIHAVACFGSAFRWFIFPDADEFYVPKRHDDLNQALADLESHSSIALPWHNFGRGDSHRRRSNSAIRDFTLRSAHPGLKDKTFLKPSEMKFIIDPCKFKMFNGRKPKMHDTGRSSSNDIGCIASMGNFTKAFYSNTNIQLNHYFTRYDEDLNKKIGLTTIAGQPFTLTQVRINALVKHMERNPVEDRCAIDYLARRGRLDIMDMNARFRQPQS